MKKPFEVPDILEEARERLLGSYNLDDFRDLQKKYRNIVRFGAETLKGKQQGKQQGKQGKQRKQRKQAKKHRHTTVYRKAEERGDRNRAPVSGKELQEIIASSKYGVCSLCPSFNAAVKRFKRGNP